MPLDGSARPRLGRGVRLRRDDLAGKILLLRSEQGFELRGAAVEIVKLCTGDYPVDAIVDRLAAAHAETDRARIAADTARLLADLAARGLIVTGPSDDAKGSSPTDLDQADAGGTAAPPAAPRPYTLIAELTYRCPLRCAYCSNPVQLASTGADLDTATWTRVFAEAAALGVMQVNLTGGEPLLRDDLAALVAAAHERELYATLITSGIPLDQVGLARLRDAGLDAVQLSLQDTDGATAARIAGQDALQQKRAVATWTRELGMPLTLNVVLHRENLPRLPSLIALGEELHADRLELAHVQLLGWALANRQALLPSADMIAEARATIAAARARLAGRMEILAVLPDYFADRPRACMDGWGRRYVVVAPDGRVLPCHAAHTLPGLAFDNVAARPLADIWRASDAFTRFRGQAWMPAPCRDCPERETDFGGCRCQAYHLTHDMTATDPACSLAPDHGLVQVARLAAATPVAPVPAPALAPIRLRRPPTLA